MTPNNAGANALAFARRGAQHAQGAWLGAADQADHLGRADVERRHQPGAVRRYLLTRPQSHGFPHQIALPVSGFLTFSAPFLRTKK